MTRISPNESHPSSCSSGCGDHRHARAVRDQHRRAGAEPSTRAPAGMPNNAIGTSSTAKTSPIRVGEPVVTSDEPRQREHGELRPEARDELARQAARGTIGRGSRRAGSQLGDDPGQHDRSRQGSLRGAPAHARPPRRRDGVSPPLRRRARSRRRRGGRRRLEERPELGCERAPGRVLGRRHIGRPEPAHHRGREEGAGLQAVQLREVVRCPRGRAAGRRSSPSVALDELARDRRRRVGEREPERLGEERVAGEDRRRLAVAAQIDGSAAPLARRRRARAGRRGRARTSARARPRPRPAAACSTRAPTASPVARQSTGRTRLPPASA